MSPRQKAVEAIFDITQKCWTSDEVTYHRAREVIATALDDYASSVKPNHSTCPDPRGNKLCGNGKDTYHEWNERYDYCDYCGASEKTEPASASYGTPDSFERQKTLAMMAATLRAALPFEAEYNDEHEAYSVERAKALYALVMEGKE